MLEALLELAFWNHMWNGQWCFVNFKDMLKMAPL
jgi:hypothetical protein